MALMLRAQARGIIAIEGAGKLSAFPPLSFAGWRGKSRPAGQWRWLRSSELAGRRAWTR